MSKDVVDVFCGAGGTSTGLIRAGYNVKIGIDSNEKAIKSFSENHEGAKGLETDVTELNADELDVDPFLMTGSPPCQIFSKANRHRGTETDEKYLYQEYLRLVEELEPNFVLMENVRGMESISKRIMREMDEIGYIADTVVLNSREFGIPQNRERLFFLGIRKDAYDAEPSFALSKLKMKVLSRKKNEEKPLKEALWGLRELKPREEKLNTDLESEEHGLTEDKHIHDGEEPPKYVKRINSGELPDKVYNHKARFHNERDRKIYSLLPEGENAEHSSIEDIMPYKIGTFTDKYYKLDREEVSKTITAHMSKDCNSYIHPEEDRGLTPREAARVQSFPDDYRFYGPYTSWFHQIGNAVPPLMAEEIGRGFQETHDELL